MIKNTNSNERFPECRADAFWLGSLVLFIIFMAARNISKQCFWLDELVTYYLASDPSWTHMMHALAGGSDGMGPFFCTTMWIWTHLTNPLMHLAHVSPETALRLPSTFFFTNALILLYRCFRPAFSPSVASLAILTGFLWPYNSIHQLTEARCYCLGLLQSAASIFIAVHIVRNDGQKIKRRLLVLNCLIQASAALSGPFSLLYSGATFAGILIYQISRRFTMKAQLPIQYLFSFLIGWLALIPWLPGLRMQSDLCRPVPIAPVPPLGALPPALLGLPLFYFVLLTLISALFAHFAAKPRSHEPAEPQGHRAQAHLLLSVALAYLGLTVGVWIWSHVGTSLFIPRYFTWNAIAYAILAAIMLAEVQSNIPPPSPPASLIVLHAFSCLFQS